MSKLDELIQKYCPNGVQYKKTKDIVKDSFWLMPSTPKFKDNGIHYITSKNIRNGKIIFKDAKFITEDDYNNISKNRPILKGDILITMIGTIGEVSIVDTDIKFYGQNIYLLRLNNKIILNKFYYYFITSNRIKTSLISKKNASSQGYIKAGSIENLFIPLPPLPVQEEIVRILDSFTKLNEKLNEELIKRKKQYEYYRDKLLNFDNKIKYMSLGELFEIKNGLNKEKEAFGKGVPIINFKDVYNNRWLDKNSFSGLVNVSEDEIERYSARKGDIFFTRTSETREDIGMASALIEDVPNCVFSGFILRARPTTKLLIPKFCAYYFSTTKVRNDIIRYASFTTRATTTGPKLSKLLMPIIPIVEQEYIVSILDKFNILCNDLLPEEIEARKKQYEYYRDKLLTFKELKQ